MHPRLYGCLLGAALLLTQACTGNKRLSAFDHEHEGAPTKPREKAYHSSSIVETTWQGDDDQGLYAIPRLLGGMDRGGEDTKEDYKASPKDHDEQEERKAQAPAAVAAQYGFHIQQVRGDGNCLFRAVADQLLARYTALPFSQDDLYKVLRRVAANHIISHKQLYTQFTAEQSPAGVASLIKAMDTDRAWAGQEAMAVLSRALQLTIVVIQQASEQVLVHKPARDNGTAYLHYINPNSPVAHYDSLHPAGNTAAIEAAIKKQEVDQGFRPPALPNIPQLLRDTARAMEEEARAPKSKKSPSAYESKAPAKLPQSPAGSSQPLMKKLVPLLKNAPSIKTLDLSEVTLKQEQMEALEEIVVKNKALGYIDWGLEVSAGRPWRAKIDQALAGNILGYHYHPTPYTHALLSEHVYTEPEKKASLTLKDGSRWRVKDASYDKNTGFGGAIYVNATTHQVVLALQGTKSWGDVKEDVAGVFASGLTEQQSATFKLTEKAAKYTKVRGFHLSITGHSLGAFLAEVAVYFCFREFNHTALQGVVFDSPGSLDWLRAHQANLPHGESFEALISQLPITTYLSAPNVVNSCNGHLGTVYRLYPRLHSEEAQKEWNALRYFLPQTSKGLLDATQGHLFKALLPCFDPKTGQPKRYQRVKDWPKISTSKTVSGTLETLFSALSGHKSQYWKTTAQLNKHFEQPPTKSAEQAFGRLFEGHYQESPLGTHEDVLTDRRGTLDYYLSKLGACKEPSLSRVQDRVVRAVLQALREQYTVKRTDSRANNRATISLKDKSMPVASVRQQMRRAIEVLSRRRIEEALHEAKHSQSRATSPDTQNLAAPAPIKFFVGRDRPLKGIATALNKPARQVHLLSGPGGIGKTQLAIQLFNGLKKKPYDHAFWLPAVNGERLKEEYFRMADTLGLRVEKKRPDAVRDISNKLAEQHCLWVFDDAPSSQVIQPFMPPEHGHVLLTSRNSDLSKWPGGVQHWPLEKFDEEDLMALARQFKVTLDKGDTKTIDYLSQNLSGYPFIIAQFFSLCKFNHQCPAELIKELQGSSSVEEEALVKELLAKTPEQDAVYTKSMVQVLQANLKAIGEASAGQHTLSLLSCFAYLDPRGIPVGWIYDFAGTSKAAVRASLRLLEQYSLVQWRDKQVYVHAVTQHVVRHLQPQKDLKSLVERLIAYAGNEREAALNADKWSSVLSHGGALYKHRAVLDEVSVHKLVTALGTACEVPCLYDEALAWRKQALSLARGTHGESAHAAVATSLHHLGVAYADKVDYTKAHAHIAQGLKMRLALYEAQPHEEVARSYRYLGGHVHYCQGNYAAALQQLEAALKICKALYKDEAHPELASTLNSMGNVYYCQGQHQAAMEKYEAALKMYRAIYKGEAHPQLAKTLNNMGALYSDQGYYKEALEKLEAALKMRRAIYKDKAHPSVADALHNMGALYSAQGQYQAAMEKLEAALKMRRAIYKGKAHPDVARTLYNMGFVYSDQGHYQAALQQLEAALKMQRAIYKDKAHPDVASTLNNMGLVYYKQGQHQAAMEKYEEVLKMHEAIYKGKAHPDVARTLYNMGIVYRRQAKYAEALPYYKQAYAMRKQSLGENHSDTQRSKQDIADVQAKLAQQQAAPREAKQRTSDQSD